MIAARLLIAVALLSGMAHGDAPEDVRKSVIDRCRGQMGGFGAATVKFCVDQDLAAYRALSRYDERHKAIIDRCASQMLAMGGWATVQFCADQDIQAERALEAY